MKTASSIPRATYRLQLNKRFTFAQATELVPYLDALGISHCYISPCLKARPGSMHGYDIVDHNSLNPEIGTPEEFDHFVTALHDHEMGLILDIVPNHMAVMGSDNAWWLDVLENGESSPYSHFFDIDWNPLKDELRGKVLIPVLPDHYGAVLERGDLKLVFREQTGEFAVVFHDHYFPLGPREYPRVLLRAVDSLKRQMGEDAPELLELQSLITAFTHLPGRQEVDPARLAERNRDKEIHKRRLAELSAKVPAIASAIGDAVQEINGDPANPASFEDLHEIIKAQTFRLANWQVASDDINYRRFFDTNGLAGICVENERVFEATHKFVLSMVAEGKVDGLRVDHPDGLYDPAQYFERLRDRMAQAHESSTRLFSHPRYTVIEKILTGTERLPSQWPVSGTTGYDFSNLVNGLFVDSSAARRLQAIYHNFTGIDGSYDDLAYTCRKLIIRIALVSELNVLANRLSRIALAKRRTCDFTLNNLRDALTEIVASFPVYRTYVTAEQVSDRDALYITRAIVAAKLRSPAADTSVFDFIREALLTRIADPQDLAYRKSVVDFAMKFQQFTSPVMAKGLEDTAFYRYNRLVSLNDVGSDLRRFGTSVEDFHTANCDRAAEWLHTMLATSTHDSKRSEDVRTRIDALSEMAGPWRLRLREWKRLNRDLKVTLNDQPAPSLNDEYLLYQTLVGVWPAEQLNREADWSTFRERIKAYMMKAIREAKQNTSWINRNEKYEAAVSGFVDALLSAGPDNRFLADFLPFQQSVARIGMWNSLSQTLLKLTCPGVPDIYQGNDLFDFSLVDPDNRRDVDYDYRRQTLEDLLKSGEPPCAYSIVEMVESSAGDKLKLHVTLWALRFRKSYGDLFQNGGYLPLKAEGEKSDHLVAFMRSNSESMAIVAVPRLIAGLLNGSESPPTGESIWKDTRILLPSAVRSARLRNILTGEEVQVSEDNSHLSIRVPDTLATLPVALLFSAPTNPEL